jgi:ornithine carbamoyltransferase
MQLGRGEPVSDTAKVLSRMVDIVMIRANDHNDVLDFAKAASIPVINGLTDQSHPCQIIADILTIEAHLGAIEGRTIAWVGDGNNVCTSLIHAATKCNFHLNIATPIAYQPKNAAMVFAKMNGADVRLFDDPKSAVAGADAVFTDTWVSMGDEDLDERRFAFGPFQVNSLLMAFAKTEAVFMHCLPAHRGEEVTADIIDGPQSLVWEAAENRIHAQKSIIAWCLNKI